jgi:hypothetical protein
MFRTRFSALLSRSVPAVLLAVGLAVASIPPEGIDPAAIEAAAGRPAPGCPLPGACAECASRPGGMAPDAGDRGRARPSDVSRIPPALALPRSSSGVGRRRSWGRP